MPLCGDCNHQILSKHEETIRNSLAFHYRNTYHAEDRKVAPGMRALEKHGGKGRAIQRTNPRGLGWHRPRLTLADDSPFGEAVKAVVKKLVLGLEHVKGRLNGRSYEIDRQAYVWDIPCLAFQGSFEARSFSLWNLHEGCYQVVVAEKVSPDVSEYAVHLWGNLVLHGRIRYSP